MESLTIPVSVPGPAESELPLAEELAGICIRAVASIAENVRNTIVFITVRFVFMSIPLFGLVKLVLFDITIIGLNSPDWPMALA
jgi:hypothetical protein